MIYIICYNDSYTHYLLDCFRYNPEIMLLEIPRETWIEDKLMSFSKYLTTTIYSSAFFNKKLKKMLSKINYDDTLILFDYLKLDNVKYILKNTLCNNIHFWFWNTVNSTTIRLMTLQNKNIKFHTFDKNDSNRFKMYLHNQIYRFPDKIPLDSEIIYDFFFIGANKNRLQYIISLNNQLINWGYKTKIILFDKNKKLRCDNGIEVIYKEIDYERVIELISQSRVLLDITKDNQIGLTLRSLEGLFFNKKVITNNMQVPFLPFYNSSNFLVLTKELTKDKLDSFFNSKYIENKYDLKSAYCVETWLKEILESNN